MKEFLDQFLKPKETTGCDIGAASTKFVALSRKSEELYLKSLGIIETDLLSDNTVAVQRAKAFLKEHGLAGSKVNLNIEDHSLKIRRMDLPEMPANDLKIAIRWNFREYVDGPIEKYSVGHSDFGDFKINGDKRPILAFGVTNDAVEKLLKTAKLVGLKPVSVEPNATALLAAFDYNVGWSKAKYSVMIDLGMKVANFVVLGDGYLLFSRPLPNAAIENLAKNLSKELGMPPEQVLGSIKSYQSATQLPEPTQTKVNNVMTSFLSNLVVEIQRSIDAFCLQFHADKVDIIYLCGGGSLIANIGQFISKNLGIVAEHFNPFEKINVGPNKIPNPQLYTVAVGLALPSGK